MTNSEALQRTLEQIGTATIINERDLRLITCAFLDGVKQGLEIARESVRETFEDHAGSERAEIIAKAI